MKDELLGFLQVDIHIPNELLEKFSKFPPLFIVDSIPKDQIHEHMKDYQEKAGRKTISTTKKLLGVTKAKRILLYTPLLKWYLSIGLRVTTIHKYLMYEFKKPFAGFLKKSVRRDMMETMIKHCENKEIPRSLKETHSMGR